MNREYQIGDLVVWIVKSYSAYHYPQKEYEVSLYGKIAKIIYIDYNSSYPYLLEFKDYINGHDGNYTGKRKGKKDHCWWCKENEIKSATDHLKFKKWIKG